MITWSVGYRVESLRARRLLGCGNLHVDAATEREAAAVARVLVEGRYAGQRVRVVTDRTVELTRYQHGGDLHICNSLTPGGCR